jgi:hypothetical protein
LAITLVAWSMVACGAQGSGDPRPGGGAATFAPSVPSASPQVKAAVHAAAAAFYGAYFTHQFAAAWALLTPHARLQIPRKLWVSVHERCLPTAAPDASQIGALTVFGEAAIVTRHPVEGGGQSSTADVFNYADGQWGYSPSEISIYLHGSANADIAAARNAGMCRSPRAF